MSGSTSMDPRQVSPVEAIIEALNGAALNDAPAGIPAVSDHRDSGEEAEDAQAGQGADGAKKKKKKKKKSKPKAKKPGVKVNQGWILDEEPAPPAESAKEAAEWQKELRKGYPTVHLPAWGILSDHNRRTLALFHTPACQRFELRTPRLRLRQVQTGDLTAIRRIKTEPIVQRTQLYGSPSSGDIKDSFLGRYILSRAEYIFAITAVNPSDVEVKPAGNLKMANRIHTTEGYLGNIALSLSYEDPSVHLAPRKGKVYTQPTFDEMTRAGVEGKMFYEIHPQLWGQGIMSEAFEEVLRFGMEELGCVRVASDPTTINEASIKLCTKNGMTYTKTVNNVYNRPQLFHEITKAEWWKIHRAGEITDRWGGKEVCRWCMNFHLAPPTIRCGHCDWAKYCSRECQRADWAMSGGHQSECDMR
ncbi:hypothetical protein IAU60_005038 [Kwoniella sp. DSM 27419]